MPRKYCVFACKINYGSQQDKTMCDESNKIPVYCDGNQINQVFLNPTLPKKSWLTEDNKHLFFDYAHQLKNIRNLWLIEKTELNFDDDGVKRVAKQLYHFESERLVKLADLNEISIAPKPIERQRVSSCLKVFSEKNI